MTPDLDPQQPQPQPQPNTSFHPFLRLPRELRDEIYKSILTAPPTTLLTLNLSCLPPLNLSILRVNKQIHQEASEIFYTTTVFPIRISRNDVASISNHIIHYIAQDTPWDNFCYRYRGKYGELLSLNSPENLVVTENKHIHPNNTHPPIPYGARFRKFRIELIDHRKLSEIPNDNSHGSASMKLLSLAVDRLSALLSPPTRQTSLSLEIHIFAKVLERIGEEMVSPPDSPIHKDTAKYYRKTIYRDMIDTIWPLTQGPWKYTIHVPESLKKEFPWLLEETLEVCRQLEAGEKKEEGVWREPTPMWDLWQGWGRGVKYVGGGQTGMNSMDEDNLGYLNGL
ncbi:hypothetical protein TWF506_005831 [Arthrobotrys conoides]|uniref:F-box domain-containing protein n=1 Tax=Arthrobotrys conoides TaxID=74498 RepID=A0AAN8PQ63_9PEZI